MREFLNFVAEPATQYVLSVRAFNNFGKGPVVYDLVYTKDKSGSFYDALVMMLSEKWLKWCVCFYRGDVLYLYRVTHHKQHVISTD